MLGTGTEKHGTAGSSRDNGRTCAEDVMCRKILSIGSLIVALVDATSASYHVWTIYCMRHAVLTGLSGLYGHIHFTGK